MKKSNECSILKYIVEENKSFKSVNKWLNNDCNCFQCKIFDDKLEDSRKIFKNKILYDEYIIMKVKINDKMRRNIIKQITNKKIKSFVLNKKNNEYYNFNAFIRLHSEKFNYPK